MSEKWLGEAGVHFACSGCADEVIEHLAEGQSPMRIKEPIVLLPATTAEPVEQPAEGNGQEVLQRMEWEGGTRPASGD